MTIDPNFQTPPPVADYMASLIPDDARSIFEPTPGMGNLVAAAELRGFHIHAAADFWLHDHSQRYDCIIMNPPFSSKSAHMQHAPHGLDAKGMKVGYQILQLCMQMSDNIIALMPWCTLTDSDVRMRTLTQYGIISLTSLPRKTFQYARIQTVILQLQKGYTGNTIFKTFNY